MIETKVARVLNLVRSGLRARLGASVTSQRYPVLFAVLLAGGIAIGGFIASRTAGAPLVVEDLPQQPSQPDLAVTSLLRGTVTPAGVSEAPGETLASSQSQGVFGSNVSPPAAMSMPTPVASAIAAPAQPAAARGQYSPNRLIIPSLGINSNWLPLGWLANGVTMDSPPGPADLGWYTFTAQPGSAGNAVFSGHVDWHTGAPALFAHLTSLHVGDEIDVSRVDGTPVQYRVVSSTWYPLYGTPAAPIVASTTTPTVTLISCGGTFDETTHEYDQRLVIRAVGSGS